MSAAEIARGLTKAQREALLLCNGTHEVANATILGLLRLGIWEIGATPLGLEVRAILEQEARDGE